MTRPRLDYGIDYDIDHDIDDAPDRNEHPLDATRGWVKLATGVATPVPATLD